MVFAPNHPIPWKEKIQKHIDKLDYGNKDISGIPGQDDGLLNSWLGTSLKISPREQVSFLEKMLATSLEVSKDAQIKTKSVMEKKNAQGQAILWKGWKLFAKTGGGQDAQRWFVGWGEKGEDKIVFAQYIGMIQDTPAIRVRAPMALDLAKESIEKLLEHM
jgi:beta-lactamase class D